MKKASVGLVMIGILAGGVWLFSTRHPEGVDTDRARRLPGKENPSGGQSLSRAAVAEKSRAAADALSAFHAASQVASSNKSKLNCT